MLLVKVTALQLSEVIGTGTVIYAPHDAESLDAVMFSGIVILGAIVSFTIMICEQVAVFPMMSATW